MPAATGSKMPDTYVLDCSVATKWVLPESDRAAALGWFDRFASGEILLIAPAVRHALAVFARARSGPASLSHVGAVNAEFLARAGAE